MTEETSVILERTVDAGHFQPGDAVHVIVTVVEADTGRRLGRYQVVGVRGEHATGEPALAMDDVETGVTVRAPARYLLHQQGCLECSIFETALCREIADNDYGSTPREQVMLMARSSDGQLLHVLDYFRLEGETEAP